MRTFNYLSMPERLFATLNWVFLRSTVFILVFKFQVWKKPFFPLDDIDVAIEQGVYLEEKPNSHRSCK